MIGGQVGSDVTATTRAFRAPRDYARPLPDLPESRFLHGAAAVDEKIYLVGGRSFSETRDGFVFDPETGNFRDLPTLPGVQSGLSVIAHDGLVYAIGGRDSFGNAIAVVRAFDTVARTWTERAPMPTARAEAAVTVLEDRIVVVGGDNGGPLQTVELYNATTNTWSSAPLLPAARAGAMAATVQGQVWVIGGVSTGGIRQTAVTSTLGSDGAITGWNERSVGIPVSHGLAFPVQDSRIVVIPGRTADALTSIPFVLATDAAAVDRRVSARSMIVPARDRRAGVLLENRFFLFGGNDTVDVGPSGVTDAVEVAAQCFNGVIDGAEEERADSGDGCAKLGVLHHSGTGTTFFNESERSVTSLQGAIDACNAHYGANVCSLACGGNCTEVTRDGNCSCSEPFAWTFGFGHCFSAAGGPGVVLGSACGGRVGNWD